ncbi:MAG TPA: M14 family zinc carboxypeptidase [Flavobacteriales bacterium]|nr:M14 family zinc carboxypeptidase [Flavobacteriales bacterium]
MRSILILLSIAGSLELSAQWRFQGDTTATWEQAIARYRELDRIHSGARLLEIGSDDDGSPMHLFVLSDGSGFTPDSIRAAGKTILWVTNAIHAGEPDGVDASMLLAQALLESDQLMGLTVNVAVCIVPVYNISGAKQRSSTSRANQNGPKEYGFRGNARNLDLNRDFIKTDSRNTRSLISAMSHWDPDIYFETHVTNGADHQYVMELMVSHPDLMDTALVGYTEKFLVPRQYEWMGSRNIKMGPYFETLHNTPEQGLTGFVDGPRYSTGYAALRQRIGILSESHMLKPYAERVNATLQLLFGTLACMNEHPKELLAARRQARASAEEYLHYATNWSIDTSEVEAHVWSGYAVDTLKSGVSGLQRTRYDHDRPTEGKVPWMNAATPAFHIERPVAYLVPQAWREVIDRLKLDAVPVEVLKDDRPFVSEIQRIEHYTDVKQPYEGHYLHRNISTTTETDTVMGRVGDVLVPMGNATDALAMEILEPRCADSYFAWGFFDSILQQKEWFSDYVFEDIAADLLAKDPVLKAALEDKRAVEPEFAKDAWAQLYFVYRRSPYFEPGYMRYPVVRVME